MLNFITNFVDIFKQTKVGGYVVSLLNLKQLAINDSGFAFNPTTGKSYHLNEIGIKIIQMLKNEVSLDDITNNLYSEFEIEKDALIQDIDFFIMQLQNLGLIGVEDGIRLK